MAIAIRRKKKQGHICANNCNNEFILNIRHIRVVHVSFPNRIYQPQDVQFVDAIVRYVFLDH